MSLEEVLSKSSSLKDRLGDAERMVMTEAEICLAAGIPFNQEDRIPYRSKNLAAQQKIAEFKSRVSYTRARATYNKDHYHGELLDDDDVKDYSQKDKWPLLVSRDAKFRDLLNIEAELLALHEYLDNLLWSLKTALNKS